MGFCRECKHVRYAYDGNMFCGYEIQKPVRSKYNEQLIEEGKYYDLIFNLDGGCRFYKKKSIFTKIRNLIFLRSVKNENKKK